MLKLSGLLKYEDIVIQCHDNPDADALASGYGLYEYFKAAGKKVRFIYGGRWQITKPNLLEMISTLEIPVEYQADDFTGEGLLITVDCQYGAGNVKKFAAAEVAIIDHHQQENYELEKSDIRPHLGSCATLVWDHLRKEKFDLASRPNLATALYYGLFTDTNNLAEIYHPLDKDMRDELNYNRQLVRKLQNCNLTLEEIEIAGSALTNYSHNAVNNVAVFKALPCDPNILGFTSDIALQVNTVDICVVYSETADGVKFSVRSCIREVMANELAAFLAQEIGSGGGHAEKAGGYISLERFKKRYPDAEVDDYLTQRVKEYYDSFDLVYSASHELKSEEMMCYRKKKLALGFVRSTDVFPAGAPLLIRTLEGDVEIFSADDLYIMIGIQGEVYPIMRQKFELSYEILSDTPYALETEYLPTVRNRITGETMELMAYAKSCCSTGEVVINARPLLKKTKVFTSWDYSHYMSGEIGDYIALRQDDGRDVYIVRKDIFAQTYEAVEGC